MGQGRHRPVGDEFVQRSEHREDVEVLDAPETVVGHDQAGTVRNGCVDTDVEPVVVAHQLDPDLTKKPRAGTGNGVYDAYPNSLPI